MASFKVEFVAAILSAVNLEIEQGVARTCCLRAAAFSWSHPQEPQTSTKRGLRYPLLAWASGIGLFPSP